ncbi:MAG: hypothetical protein ACQKBY_12730 [Verrucomicrobiales bacterium]
MKRLSPPHRATPAPPGFALITAVTLLLLLAIVTLGFLSLGTATVRTGQRQAAQDIARANARMALTLALGRLQKELGPDQRVSFPANQKPPGDLSPGAHHWTGVAASWNSAEVATRPDAATRFRRWLVSGDPALTGAADSPENALPAHVTLFDHPSDPSARVAAPLVPASAHPGGQTASAYAWWIGDENTKALVRQRKPASGLDEAWSHAQAPTATGLPLLPGWENLDREDRDLAKSPTRQSLSLLPGVTAETRDHFHDLTTRASGLFTDTARGGLRRDLSLFLDFPQPASTPSYDYPTGLPNDDRLYPDGITWEELWLYHNLWQALQDPVPGLASMTGGDLAQAKLLVTPPGTGIESAKAFTRDPFAIYKSIRHIRVQWVSSLWAKPNPQSDPNEPQTYQICWVSDPVLTVWNPFDAPLALHPDAYYSIKFWTIPYTIKIYKNNQLVVDKAFHNLSTTNNDRYIFSTVTGTARSTYYGRSGTPDPLVLMPGEVLILSESRSGEPRLFSTNNAERSIAMKAGWNLGRGRYVPIPGLENIAANERLEIELGPNNQSLNNDAGYGQRLLSYPYSYGRDRRGEPNVRDFVELWGTKIYSPPAQKAIDYPNVFPSFSRRQLPPPTFFTGSDKELILSVSLQNRTEDSATSWNRFYSASTSREFLMLEDSRNLATHPLEADVRALSGTIDPNMPQSGLSHPNRGLFGGSFYDPNKGQDIIITQSVPREPPLSLGAFQHALANGNRERMAGGALNPGSQSLSAPEMSHAISNSYALPIFAPDDYENPASGTRPYEQDHSWQVNRQLWDSTFLSGIVQHQAPHHAAKKSAAALFSDFAQSGGLSPLANPNIRPLFTDAREAIDALFTASGEARSDAAEKAAAFLRHDGTFNINSTSVAAWTALLASRRDSLLPVAADPNEPTARSDQRPDGTPLGKLHLPHGSSGDPDQAVISADQLNTAADPAQWRGYRLLSDEEITRLAEEIVAQVRLRGPFLSLADFINRRLDSDPDLALSGPLQSAIDLTLNEKLLASSARTGDPAAFPSGLAFPEAAALPKTIGSPGHVMQADLLTALGPALSARSDTFRIRAYGEARHPNGSLAATAYCEALVERQSDFLDPGRTAAHETPAANSPNATFGRRFRLLSFRWLPSAEWTQPAT